MGRNWRDHANDLVTPEEDAAEQERATRRTVAAQSEKAARRGLKNRTRKGKRGERTAKAILEKAGAEFVRLQPRSGSIEGLPHDVVGMLDDGQVSAEAKQFGKSKWRSLDRMRDGADVLVLCLDQQRPGEQAPEPMLFMPAATLQRFVNHAYAMGVIEMRDVGDPDA